MGDYNLGVGSRIEHPKYGKGVVVDMDTEFYSIWFKDGNSTRGISRDFQGLVVLEKSEADVVPITLDDMIVLATYFALIINVVSSANSLKM
jgi:hypothetical protein